VACERGQRAELGRQREYGSEMLVPDAHGLLGGEHLNEPFDLRGALLLGV
jgi:hypothetical protein